MRLGDQTAMAAAQPPAWPDAALTWSPGSYSLPRPCKGSVRREGSPVTRLGTSFLLTAGVLGQP